MLGLLIPRKSPPFGSASQGAFILKTAKSLELCIAMLEDGCQRPDNRFRLPILSQKEDIRHW